MRYDAIVVGAGPAGSTAARILAREGASVLLLDRARFPRDKPCGGGVTLRAAGCQDLDLSPVVERTVTGARFSLRMGVRCRVKSSRPPEAADPRNPRAAKRSFSSVRSGTLSVPCSSASSCGRPIWTSDLETRARAATSS